MITNHGAGKKSGVAKMRLAESASSARWINNWFTCQERDVFLVTKAKGWLRWLECYSAMFLKLWFADHKWSSGSALVVLLN
jgi:hypothetical protein